MPQSSTKPIIAATLLAGTLDILDPIVFFHLRNNTAPIRILQSVASGLLGRDAFAGGTRTALLGLALHFFIAFLWATLFILAARSLPFLTQHPIRSGLLYGAIIYIVMNYIVLPHTRAAPSLHPTHVVLVNGIAAILLLIGLPISLVNRHFATRLT